MSGHDWKSQRTKIVFLNLQFKYSFVNIIAMQDKYHIIVVFWFLYILKENICCKNNKMMFSFGENNIVEL